MSIDMTKEYKEYKVFVSAMQKCGDIYKEFREIYPETLKAQNNFRGHQDQIKFLLQRLFTAIPSETVSDWPGFGHWAIERLRGAAYDYPSLDPMDVKEILHLLADLKDNCTDRLEKAEW